MVGWPPPVRYVSTSSPRTGAVHRLYAALSHAGSLVSGVLPEPALFTAYTRR